MFWHAAILLVNNNCVLVSYGCRWNGNGYSSDSRPVEIADETDQGGRWPARINSPRPPVSRPLKTPGGACQGRVAGYRSGFPSPVNGRVCKSPPTSLRNCDSPSSLLPPLSTAGRPQTFQQAVVFFENCPAYSQSPNP